MPCRPRLLHRLDALHRLQGLRGRVQGVERGARATASRGAATPTTTRGARALDLAAREVRRADDRRPGRGGERARRYAASFAGISRPTSASTASTPAASRPARPASIVRTEFGGVFVQPDVCNGCGYCVVACPFGVVDRRPDDGRAFKCTFCYDRQKAGSQPACATACPTESILFGEIDELREQARRSASSSCTRAG